MKSEIDYRDSTFICSCGARYEMKSTRQMINNTIEVCANCHRAYTGKTRAQGNADRVNQYYEKYQRS